MQSDLYEKEWDKGRKHDIIISFVTVLLKSSALRRVIMLELREGGPNKRDNDCFLLVHPFYMHPKLVCFIRKLFFNPVTWSEGALVPFIKRLMET